ncbi:MAG: agmatine/peptidylarginine deiminase [Bermanella sp.]|jgi:agmatine/peptidylarginine deiminase|uniref:agmatine deiminase family protein n=1 Tax=Glaciecola sp. 33A TaxID=2057807 RepID=UPI000C33D58B|nr:agmatine deiminase family protein [Glaciecola sp. 33A]PKI02891.1 agmatine deiminase family protein [Glaciecola sp. 33A]
MSFKNSVQDLTLLPEWAEQEAVILAWPNVDTDWHPWLHEVQITYVDIINAINDANAIVILLCRKQELVLIKSLIPDTAKVLCVTCDYNDTWARDYAFLTCESANGNVPVSFRFNGWGQKFDATKDDTINRLILASLCQQPMQHCDIVLEGGALEIDQNQHLISTRSCLFNASRNGTLTEKEYVDVFTHKLGAANISILEYGYLEGDDTDGHIDTLVRFTPLHGLVIQGAYNRPNDSHFDGLFKLRMECQKALPTHAIYELPLPEMHNQDGERLPASYANFLICNKSVLFPIYKQEEDVEALKIIQNAFPNHKIVPLNCAPLVQQFGSLHCITMQVPCDTIKPEIIEKGQTGVCEL